MGDQQDATKNAESEAKGEQSQPKPDVPGADVQSSNDE